MLSLAFAAQAQVFPTENSQLHYRLIGFSFPANKEDKFTLQIAEGVYNDETSFEKKIVVTVNADKNKILAEVPAFGTNYTWRFTTQKNNTVKKSPLYHFKTGSTPEVDTATARFRITVPAEKYTDAYVFLDNSKILYNMKGEPIWYLPHTPDLVFEDKIVRDLKMTSQGTITFVSGGGNAYEINYNADVLWKAPNTGEISGDTCEHYNHEFTRLNNGNYMAAGMEYTWLDAPPGTLPHNTPAGTTPKGNGAQQQNNTGGNMPGDGSQPKMKHRMNPKMTFGTLIEYDSKGKIVWSWKSAPYFRTSDVLNYIDKNGRPINDVHQNSFFFDEKEKVIYVSYKNISRIIKVKYPEGNVLESYGETFVPDVVHKDDGLFCYQHSCRLSQKGYLYLFNNNVCNPDNGPQLLMMQLPDKHNPSLKTVWQYNIENERKFEMQKWPRQQQGQPANNQQPPMGQTGTQSGNNQDGPRIVPIPVPTNMNGGPPPRPLPGGRPDGDDPRMANQQGGGPPRLAPGQKPPGDAVSQSTGGNVIELPDGSIFASLCTPYSKVFIVNKDKKILWAGIPEKMREPELKWIPEFEYRANIIPTRKELEDLIWNNR